MLDTVLDGLADLSANPWFYVIIFIIALLDSVIPVVPSETTVILGGIAAGQDSLQLVIVIVAGATGAIAGDSIAYWIGRRAGDRLEQTFLRKPSRQHRLHWAKAQLEARGGMLLVTARFIPGGRTAITLSSGLTQQPYQRFLAFDTLAGVLWATYAASLGYFFGNRFKDNHTAAFIYAFGAALSVTALIEVVRWFRHRGVTASVDA